ncbi:E3 ubiquitin-protein ligase TRIM7-like [Labeo rohita]|uniref:E3 ubiquitin-protein ligase TRIM7-like n=1 Tax=Labeo rohita TaxID=84645 RepID=UPI0021E2BF6E|nr:E3 ubiquitin-protein ligase TRIM7-like [Labeo rohita]
MAFAAAEDQNIALSARSLQGPHVKNVGVTVSYPFIKPNLRGEPQQDFVEIFKTFGKACRQGFKKCACKSTDQKDKLTLHESKHLIRELSAELDRVVQFKKCPLMSGKLKNKGTKEEQQYYILQWAEELKQLQMKQKEEEEGPSTYIKLIKNGFLALQFVSVMFGHFIAAFSFFLCLPQKPATLSETDSEIKLRKAKKILSDWSWKLKQMKQNSVCLKGEFEETMKDLHKQWKNRESSILPVMDWMMWTVLQSESSENASPRQWVKNKLRSKDSVGLHIPNSVWNWITQSKAAVILDPEWRVGVVKESASRHGFVTMNTKAGYWNLRLQLGTLMALTEPVTKLNLPKPSKIGVYLDLEEGHVSFYDAEKRRHIYTFNIECTGKENIYPMFGTVETDKAMVISS